MRKISIIALLLVSSLLSAQTKKKTTTKKTTTKTTKSTGGGILDKITTVATGSNVLNTVSSLSETDIVGGLKQALTQGSGNAANQLNQVNGFNGNPLVKIPFPPDAQIVATKLRSLGFGAKVDEFEKTLNRAAESAAKSAAPIFVNAVTNMTFSDAKSILTGPDNSATTYLQSSTSSALATAFTPFIKTALNSTTATQKWSELASLYNQIPFVSKVETDLVKYTTNKALSGLFIVLAGEELKIRKDPAARATDLMQKVFGAIK